MKEIFAIAKKEYMDNWRNKWIIAVSAIFLILTLVTSYFSKGKWSDMSTTIAGMMLWVVLLISIISLMLGYATIVGEQEKGSLPLLLSYPVSREETILGKFLGLSCVIISTLLVGFGFAGIIIGIKAEINLIEYFSFIFASILFALVYLSIAIFFSSFLKKRSTAIGAVIFLWFLFSIIWDMILTGLLIINYGLNFIEKGGWMAPNWYYIAAIINPNEAFGIFVTTIIKMEWMRRLKLPSYYNPYVAGTILFLWTIISLSLAIYIFRKRDL